MLEDICNLVETDFAFEMELKSLPKSKPYTQEEASHMSDIIGKVYSIAHCIHCEACQVKYIIK